MGRRGRSAARRSRTDSDSSRLFSARGKDYYTGIPGPRMARARCRRCDWQMISSSHPEVVEAYHDHVREEHPQEWHRI
nr:DUF6349 family protein [Halorussus rarus]